MSFAPKVLHEVELFGLALMAVLLLEKTQRDEEKPMARPLDGIALRAYFRRLGFGRETQEMLTHIRSSPPK